MQRYPDRNSAEAEALAVAREAGEVDAAEEVVAAVAEARGALPFLSRLMDAQNSS
jgi:hypothetical protein